MVKPSVLPLRTAHFSWLRTRWALERTFLAWVRTGASLIGFGFTIFQFFDRLDHMTNLAPAKHPILLRVIPLALIALGSGALMVAIKEYRDSIAYLWSEEFRDIAGEKEKPIATPALMTAAALSAIGLVTLAALLRRL